MRTLQIALHALGTQLALVEGKVVARLKSNHGFIFYQQRDAALLAAKTTVCIDCAVGDDTGIEAFPDGSRRMGPKVWEKPSNEPSGTGMVLAFLLRMKIIGVFRTERAFLQARIHIERHSGRSVGSMHLGTRPQFALS